MDYKDQDDGFEDVDFSWSYPYTEDKQTGERTGTRIVATFLAVAVLFLALAGSVYLIGYAKVSLAGNAYVEEEQAVNLATIVNTEKAVTLVADVSAQNKHFSLEAASVLTSTETKEALSIREIAARLKPAVVAITTDMAYSDYMSGQVRQFQSAGSGFIISEDGYVVTNAHVIENATRIQVFLEDGRNFDAVLVGEDSYSDVAVLKIDAEGLPTAPLGDSNELEVGELAVAIGNPTGRLSGTVTAGIISAVDRQISDFNLPLVQTDATINSGNSGGALINSFGEVIGINTLKINSSGSMYSSNTYEGLNFAIPINEAKPVIEALIQNGVVTRAVIGISVEPITDIMVAQDESLVPGLLILQVEAGSAAADAGLKPGDIITSFNGKAVSTNAELRRARDAATIGDVVEVACQRDGRTIIVQVEIRAAS